MSARSTILALAAGLALVAGPHAQAQQQPPSNVLKIDRTPDEATRATIQAFIDAHMKRIATGSPEQVQEARKALVNLLRKPDCSLMFYVTFLQLATPDLESILKSGDAFRATNALLVVRQIRCAAALTVILDQCSIAEQSDTRLRVAASAMVGPMIRGGAVEATGLDGVARRLRENAEMETNPFAASQLIEDLGVVATTAKAAKLPNTVRNTLDETVRAFVAALNRAAKPESSDFAMTVPRGLLVIREIVLTMSVEQQKTLRTVLEPVLKQVEALTTRVDAASRDTSAAVDASERAEIVAAESPNKTLARMVGVQLESLKESEK
jgi:hypothetical protein